MNRFEGQVAVITGGSSGFGHRGIRTGGVPIITGRDEASLKRADATSGSGDGPLTPVRDRSQADARSLRTLVDGFSSHPLGRPVAGHAVLP